MITLHNNEDALPTTETDFIYTLNIMLDIQARSYIVLFFETEMWIILYPSKCTYEDLPLDFFWKATFWRAQEFQFTMYVPIFQTGSNLQCLVSQRHATTKPRLSPNCSDRCSTQPNMLVFFWSDIHELSKRFLNDRVLNKAFIFLTSQWSFVHPLQLAVLCIMCPNFPFLPGCFFLNLFCCFVRNTMVLWIFITDGTVFFPQQW